MRENSQAVHPTTIREVFLGDALTSASLAAEVRRLVAKRVQNPAVASAIGNRLYLLREQYGGGLVNVEDSTVTYLGRKVIVKIKNCWRDTDGKPYVMKCSIEDWLHFGKPFTPETRKKQSLQDPWANYVKVNKKWQP